MQIALLQNLLPPDEILDEILESCESQGEILPGGYHGDVVRHILRMFRSAEFKRKRAALGVTVASRAYGTRWRMPIALKG